METPAAPTVAVESVGGRSMLKHVTWFLQNKLLWSIGEAEKMKGSAPTTPEVVVVFFHHYTRLFTNGYINAFLQNLYREDLFYADKGFLLWSLTGSDGSEERKLYEKFSERFLRLYPGYILDRHMHIVAKPETAVINLKALMSLLKSKNARLWEQSKWMFDKNHFRYLDGEANPS